MSDVVIRATDLGKRYRIGANVDAYRTLRGTLTDALTKPFRPRARAAERPHVWALKDVAFEIRQGQTVGLIGRNGAGKSTLLKVLSRITEPTTGHADVVGRVGTLLEVGTGFHLELTGRENVFLSGAILGMRRSEVTRQFEEIVEFAEIGRFIDTPCKFYSSGMYMRLAFAVAAHLNPDILLVDEVLAVGDAQFQKKCLGKMDAVARAGRTVVFVGHNLGAVAQLCQSCMLLEGGQLVHAGDTQSVINRYLASIGEVHGATAEFPVDPAKAIQTLAIASCDEAGTARARFDLNDTITLVVRYAVHEHSRGLNIGIKLSRNGVPLWFCYDTDTLAHKREVRPTGEFTYEIRIPAPLLKAGVYSVSVQTGKTNIVDIEHFADAIAFQVEELTENTAGSGHSEYRPGMIIAPMTWTERPTLASTAMREVVHAGAR